MISVSATTSFEVEVNVTGTFLPGCPEQGPTYACGGQPAEPDSMEDVEVVSLMGLRPKAPRLGRSHEWESVDLLSGVSAISPEAVLKILTNVRDFLGDSADEALMAELPEDDRE